MFQHGSSLVEFLCQQNKESHKTKLPFKHTSGDIVRNIMETWGGGVSSAGTPEADVGVQGAVEGYLSSDI